jgi:hypothetical protein
MDDLTGQIGICTDGTTWIAKEIEWATRSPCHHVVVCINNTECVSAEPGGVILRTIHAYGHLTLSRFPLTNQNKAAIVAAARAKLTLPYNYAIYLPLLISRITDRPVPVPVAEWLGHRRNVDCSQLADDIYRAAGIPLFDPGPSDIITPGDFWRLFVTRHFITP